MYSLLKRRDTWHLCRALLSLVAIKMVGRILSENLRDLVLPTFSDFTLYPSSFCRGGMRDNILVVIGMVRLSAAELVGYWSGVPWRVALRLLRPPRLLLFVPPFALLFGFFLYNNLRWFYSSKSSYFLILARDWILNHPLMFIHFFFATLCDPFHLLRHLNFMIFAIFAILWNLHSLVLHSSYPSVLERIRSGKCTSKAEASASMPRTAPTAPRRPSAPPAPGCSHTLRFWTSLVQILIYLTFTDEER